MARGLGYIVGMERHNAGPKQGETKMILKTDRIQITADIKLAEKQLAAAKAANDKDAVEGLLEFIEDSKAELANA
jgi:hypothetical protein